MGRKLPMIITNEEYSKLIAGAKKAKYVLKKNRLSYIAAMILAGEAGLRISEIVGYSGKNTIQPLQKSQVDNNRIKVIGGKGQKDRVVPRPKGFTDKAVAMLPLKIQRRALQHFITRLGHEVLGKHMTFHTLRHYFCTECIRRGLSLHEVQMFAGHQRLDTTGIYLHASPDEALKNYEEVF